MLGFNKSLFGTEEPSPVALSGAYTISAQDDGITFNCTTALTVTVPSGLVPRPAIIIKPPPIGNLTIITPSGTATRARTTNPVGIFVSPFAESDGYGVSGS